MAHALKLNDYRKSESEFGPIGTDFFNTIAPRADSGIIPTRDKTIEFSHNYFFNRFPHIKASGRLTVCRFPGTNWPR
jgi:hypothetical protein